MKIQTSLADSDPRTFQFRVPSSGDVLFVACDEFSAPIIGTWDTTIDGCKARGVAAHQDMMPDKGIKTWEDCEKFGSIIAELTISGAKYVAGYRTGQAVGKVS